MLASVLHLIAVSHHKIHHRHAAFTHIIDSSTDFDLEKTVTNNGYNRY
jgi:hypothetical protein